MANLMDNVGGFAGKFKHEPTEVERVQANITRVEAQMHQKLVQIGQMYYRDNMYNVSIEPKYRELIDAISKLDENRKGFYAHKLRLEGNMSCINCGKIIPYGTVFCPVCGKRADVKETEPDETLVQPSQQVQQPQQTGKVCPTCGAIYADMETRFCVTCGTSLG